MAKLSPYATRVPQFDEWRGACMAVFARAERAIAQCLMAAKKADEAVKLHHMAGRRLSDVEKLATKTGGTAKQVAAFGKAWENWKRVEGKRRFLAHGTALLSHDVNGDWVVLLDMIDIRANVATEERWPLTQSEAKTFLSELESAFKGLSGQIGHLRKRLT